MLARSVREENTSDVGATAAHAHRGYANLFTSAFSVLVISRITTLLFDLDETLVRPPDDGEKRLEAAFEAAGVDPFFDLGDFSRVAPRVDGDGPLDFRMNAFRMIAEESGRPKVEAEDVARAFEMPTASEFEPVPKATDIVERLRDREYHLALVTNGPEAKQREKLRNLSLETTFDSTVFGEPDRGFKPDFAPFHAALDELGVEPEQAVKIGDRLAVDIEPAIDLGITTVWFPNDGVEDIDSHPADFVIRELETLLDEPWKR